MTTTSGNSVLQTLSSELSGLVEQAGHSVVRVDDGTRLTATGLFWSEDGLVVTTSHGVERDEDVVVELGDGTRLPAVVAGRDHDTDVALLRIEAKGIVPLPTAPEAEVKVGQLVLALARPGQSGLQATMGLINARRESQSNGRNEYILQTDATLYPGFSGGALIDMAGRLVGLTNLSFGRGRGVALGVPTLNNVVSALLTQGRVVRGYLGIRLQPVPLPESAQKESASGQDRALIIIGVETGSPAETGGLLLGDTLLAIGEVTIRDVDDLRKALRQYGAGQSVALVILRGGERRDLNVTLGAER